MRTSTFVLCLAAFFLLCLSGCGTRTDTTADKQTGTKSQARTVTKEVIRETPLANGGKVIERTLTTDVVSDENSTQTSRERMDTGLDAGTTGMVNALGQVAGAVIGAPVSAATGGLFDGNGIATAITALVGAGVTAYGASKAAESKQLRQERDFHKDDADKAYRQLETKSVAG